MTGGVLRVKPPVLVADPPEPVSTTSFAPKVPAGTTNVIEVALTFEIEVPATPPKVTADVPVKFVPVIVIVAPPD